MKRKARSAAGNACAVNGMGTEWYFGSGAPYRGRGGSSTSFGDSWGSAGYYTYGAYIKCVDGAGNAGNASGTGTAGVQIYVPAPTNPTFVNVVGGAWSNSSTGGWMFVGITINGGGSMYANGYTTQVNVINTAGGGTGWGNAGCVPDAVSFQTRAQAYGPGGTSDWTYGPSAAVTSLTRTQQVCGE